MSTKPRTDHVRILVVHHNMIVLQDLCETVSETAIKPLVDRAETLSPEQILGTQYDAALIEVSRNVDTLRHAQDRVRQTLKRVVWITDDMHPAPNIPQTRASLRQPFRTEDVTAALKAAGVVPSDA